MVISTLSRLQQKLSISWDDVNVRLLGVLMAVLAGMLRLLHVNADGYSLDEVYSIWIAGKGVDDLVREIWLQGADPTPPVYYVLLHAFLQLGEIPVIVRAFSILSGLLIVWLTFHLAVDLFDLRVAAISAGLLAIAPIHIEYSLTARAYVPAALWALTSLFFFTRIVLKQDGQRPAASRWHWIGFVLASVLAVCTHYLTVLALFAYNMAVLLLWVVRSIRRSTLLKWIGSQVAVAILLLPIALSVLQMVEQAQDAERWTWLQRPGLQEVAKSLILFGVGDPSYGTAAVTGARILALLTIGLLLGLGIWIVHRRRQHQIRKPQLDRVLVLACVAFVPWMLSFSVSQIEPIYKEKYILYVMPPLFILFGWIITRAHAHAATGLLSLLLAVTLFGLTGRSLAVYYTSPSGEQWREATEYLQAHYERGDLVVLSPGYYVRPFAYYHSGEFPEEAATISEAPAVVMLPDGQFSVPTFQRSNLPTFHGTQTVEMDTELLASHSRVWLVHGYMRPHPAVEDWLTRHLQIVEQNTFLGTHVNLLQYQGQD